MCSAGRILPGIRIREREDRSFYSTLSLWDTFRAWNPLQTLLDTAPVPDAAVRPPGIDRDLGVRTL